MKTYKRMKKALEKCESFKQNKTTNEKDNY